MRNAKYLLSILPGLAAIAGNVLGGYYSALCIVIVLGVFAATEWFLGKDVSNEHSEPRDFFPEFIVYLNLLVFTGVWVSLLLGLHFEWLQGSSVWLAAVSSGIAAGNCGIIPAHELIHKANPVKQWLGKYLLTGSGNVYFHIHHLRVHHRFVGTHKDSATARRNESVYSFFLRTTAGQFSEAWESEANRLRKMGKSAWGMGNQILRNCLWQLFIGCLVFWQLGITGLAVLGVYALTANFLLEYVNYIEHYGLYRAETERVNELHSWNSDSNISRYMLIDLSRHADHHYFASKPYHTLNTYENAPTLPGGYAALFFPALVPPLWRALVHPRLDAWEKNREQIKPAHAESI
jgi:alkane 1-monooxygenase